MFIFKHRLEFHHFSASLSNLQVFWGAAALSLATSLLRNPSRRPDLPESENLRLFHVEHTIYSHLNIGLNFTTSLQAHLIFKFFWGGGSFPRNFTSPKSEPPPRPSRTGKLLIVPRGTHNLFTFKYRLEVSHLSASFPELQVFQGWWLFPLLLHFSAVRATAPTLPDGKTSDCSTWNTQFVHI